MSTRGIWPVLEAVCGAEGEAARAVEAEEDAHFGNGGMEMGDGDVGDLGLWDFVSVVDGILLVLLMSMCESRYVRN